MTNPNTIHIVDDNREFRTTLAEVLRASGYDVIGFDSAVQYLEEFDGQVPSCMIVDLQMPVMGGLTLQSELQKRKIVIPTIVLSAYTSLEQAVRSVKLGACDVFQKPCRPEKLLDAVKRYANGRQRGRFSTALPNDPSYVIRRWDFIGSFFRLSRRQCEVAKRICQSMSNDEIAYELHISSNTVRMHIKALYEKLKVHDRVGVAMRCLGADLLAPGE